jgi:hypothetical protein
VVAAYDVQAQVDAGAAATSGATVPSVSDGPVWMPGTITVSATVVSARPWSGIT